VVRLRGILERFLNAVGCLDACFVADETPENLPLPTKVGQTQASPRVTDQTEPSYTGRSPLRTSSGWHAGPVYSAGDGRIRIDNLFFIFFNK
jgi:hypothetical protein